MPESPLPPLPVLATAADAVPVAPPCLSRRAFVIGHTLLPVAALLASACGDGQIGAATGPTGPVDVTVTLADYPALATVGGLVRLVGTPTPIAVVRASASQYRAFSLVCTHQGTTVNISGNGFLCPNHGAMFNSSGTWTGGQPTTNLREFAVTADAGTLRITTA